MSQSRIFNIVDLVAAGGGGGWVDKELPVEVEISVVSVAVESSADEATTMASGTFGVCTAVFFGTAIFFGEVVALAPFFPSFHLKHRKQRRRPCGHVV